MAFLPCFYDEVELFNVQSGGQLVSCTVTQLIECEDGLVLSSFSLDGLASLQPRDEHLREPLFAYFYDALAEGM